MLVTQSPSVPRLAKNHESLIDNHSIEAKGDWFYMRGVKTIKNFKKSKNFWSYSLRFSTILIWYLKESDEN